MIDALSQRTWTTRHGAFWLAAYWLAGYWRVIWSAALADIIWLHPQSAKHKYMFLADQEWQEGPPFKLMQFRLFRRNGRTFAYASWAKVTPEVRERLQNSGQWLKPEEWACGDEVVLMDVVAPFGGAEAVVKCPNAQAQP